MAKPIIQLENISKIYTGTGGVGLGLRKISCSFNLGDFVIITGPSGSGKTTLLNIISGMDTYEEGTLYINGEDASYYGPKEYEEYRRNYVSFIFQNYNLIDSFTVYQNVELALIARGYDKKELKSKVLSIIAEVGLSNRLKHRVTQLSGGEKQRVAIARALASDAPIMVCDEITGNLDSKTSAEIISLLARVAKDKLVLLVSHDQNEAIAHATRIITMHDGMIEQDRTIKINEPISSEVTLAKNYDVKKIDVAKLGIRYLLSTPKKLFLLLLIFVVITILSAYSYSIYVLGNQGANNSWMAYYDNFTYYPGRIVVKKEDNSALTTADLDYLKQINGVKNIIESDIVLDESIYYYFKEIEDSMNYGNIRSLGDISSRDILYGRMPEKESEIVMSNITNYNLPSGSELIDLDIRARAEADLTIYDFKVVGIIDSTRDVELFINDAIIKEMANSVICQNYLNIKVQGKKMVSGEERDYYNNEVYHLQVDSNLNQGKGRIENFYYSDDETFEVNNSIVKFTTIYQQSTLNNLTIDVKNSTFNSKVDYEWDWRYWVENAEVEYYNTLYLSQADFNELDLDTIYQVSLTVDNPSKAQAIASEIETGLFYAQVVKTSSFDFLSVFSLISNILILFFVIILLICIYFLGYFAIKNVIYSNIQGFLVMRSLGIDGKKISLQVYAQMLFVALNSFILIFITWFIMRLKARVYFIQYLAKLTFGQILGVGIIVMLLALFLAFRLVKKVLSSTIVTKEMA